LHIRPLQLQASVQCIEYTTWYHAQNVVYVHVTFKNRRIFLLKLQATLLLQYQASTVYIPYLYRTENQGSPRAAAAHSGPAFDPMGARLGPAKSVRFSCGNTIIPQVFNPAPPTSRPHPDPDPISVSGRPRRVRRSLDRLGISVDPLGSPLGGEL
jgi:hypothetical protein